jgi:hypothetical protein
VAHYILVGFGNTNQSLANFLAENAHFSNLKRARITIAYRSEEESAVRRFQSLYPKFFPATPHLVPDAWHPPAALDRWGYGVELVSKSGDQVPTTVEDVDWNRSCGVPFAVNGGFVQMEGGATSPSFVDPLIAVCKTPNVRPIVFIGSSNDEENCAEAIELRELLDERLKIDNRSRYANRDNEVSIFAYVPEHPSLFALMNSRLQPDQPLDCVAWGDCKASCTYEQLNSELVRKLAEELFYDFYRDRTKPFFKASPWEIQSNRKAALHLNTKLSVFSLKIITPPKDEPLADDRSLVPGSRLGSADALMRHCVERKRKIQGLSADERSLDAEIRRLLETTVRMEHNRYLAERLLQDWSVGQRSLKGELENRRRPGMVDWDNLQPADRQKDQKQIQRILDSMIHYSQTKENIRLSLAFRSDSEDLMPPDSDSQSTPEPKHLNAGGQLLPEFGAILRVATKHQSLWARRVTEAEQIESLESKSQTAKPGDFVCRGIQGELWPQSEKSLLGSYTASGEKDTQGFERYDPRPDAPAVEATQVNEPFYVIASWGRLDGKPGDYVVRRQNDPSDIWIVDRAIFENSYKFQTE